MKDQEYYYNAGYVTIWGEVKDKPDTVIVVENGDELSVVRRELLVKKEDSYYYQQAKRRADELRLITAKAQEQFDELVEKVIEKATSALSARMRINMLFGAGMSSWAVAVADELEKLVKEETPKVVKGK